MPGPCRLAGVLAEEEKRLTQARERGLIFSLSLPPDLPPVAIDAEPLRQTLGALIDNAVEALTGPGSVSVSARLLDLSRADALDLYGDAQPGPHVEICVADTGGGLTPEAESRLFCDPFYTSKPRRRGFGLAIAYGLLHAHRGGLRLYNGERGVVARVVLPVAPSRPSAGSGSERLGGEKLLVVDDDPLVLQFISTTLGRAGYRVQTCGCAADALEAYSAHPDDPFRLVLSDVIMPHVNGVELARRILARDPAAQVLFMSGQVGTDYAAPDLTSSPFPLLAKPFRPEGLLRAVRGALDRSPDRTASVPALAPGTCAVPSRP